MATARGARTIIVVAVVIGATARVARTDGDNGVDVVGHDDVFVDFDGGELGVEIFHPFGGDLSAGC